MNLFFCLFNSFKNMRDTIVIFVLFSFSYTLSEECKKLSSCSCQFNNGSIIDLSLVASKDSTKPKFTERGKNDSYEYRYNPCYSFSYQSCKDNVAVCQTETSGQLLSFTAGQQNKVNFFLSNSNQLIVNYSAEDMGVIRQTMVTLVCQKSAIDRLDVYGEGKPLLYSMTLYSECACPDGCLSKESPNDGLSTGSILVIFFFVILCCYLFGGIMFQKIVKGAEGLEMIPHYEFWIDFPLLVRDGVLYVLNGCRTEASYERI